MKPIYRSLFVAAFFALPLSSLFAQYRVDNVPPSVEVLMPLSLGQYVEYNQYDTASSGQAPHVSYSSYAVLANGLTFKNDTGVVLVADTLGSGDPTGVHNIHYHYTAAGGLQVFADSALLNSILPSVVGANATVPNAWVDMYRTDTGSNAYPIMTLNSTYQTIPITITITGKYDGTDAITVSGVNYSNAQKFEIDVLVTSALGNLISDESDWLASGIGIIETQIPLYTKTFPVVGPVTVGGRAKAMIASGVVSSSVSQPASLASSSIQFYPNPASDNVTLSMDRPANHVFLYDATGRMIRSFDLATHTGDALFWVKDLSNGAYLARVQCADGSVQSAHFMIQH